jgi:hypothetical protein
MSRIGKTDGSSRDIPVSRSLPWLRRLVGYRRTFRRTISNRIKLCWNRRTTNLARRGTSQPHRRQEGTSESESDFRSCR